MAPKKFGMTKRESDARRASASIKRSLPKKSTWTPPKQPTMTTRKEGADVVATSRYGTKYKPQAPGASKSVLQRVDELGGGAAEFVFPQKTAGKIVKRQPLDAEDYLALASLVPVPGVKVIGKGAQAVSKGAKALANPTPAYAATKATLPKAAGTTGISGLKSANKVAATSKAGTAAAGINIGRSGKYISLAKKPSDVFTTPKPTKAMFTKDGVVDEAAFKAATTKFKKAKTAWENNAKETQKFKQARSGADTSSSPASATTANPTAERLTPRQIARERAAQARLDAAGGDIAAAGRQKGTGERKFQDSQRGQARPLGEKSSDLMRAPEGSNPRPATNMTPPERVTARPSAKTRPPRRSRYTTQAGYDRALKKWENSNTSALPSRTENVAESVAPKAPSRRGGFKETGKRYGFEGKTGKGGEPKMTPRPNRTAEADVSEATIRETKQFQGIRPGKPIPEYRNVIDNLPDAKPAPKAAAAPKKQSAKSKAGTKPAETPAAPAAAAPKAPKKSAAAKPAETPVETPAAPAPAAAKTPKKTAAKKTTPAPAKKTTPAAATPAKKTTPAKKSTPAAKKPSAKKQAAPAPAEPPLPPRPKGSKFRPTSKPGPVANLKPEEYDLKVFNPAGKRYKADVKAQEALNKLTGKTPLDYGTKAAAKKPKDKTRIIAGGVATTGTIGATGAALKVARDSDVSPNEAKTKPVGQAAMDDARTRRLTARREQFEKAKAAAKPKKKFGAAGESKFIKGRSAVRQSTIDQINKQGMAKSLAAVKSRRNDPEYLEAIRRYYGAKRLKEALKG